MKALVTGATGFIGAAVMRALLAKGHDVRVLVRPASERTNIRNLDVEVAIGDLTDARSLPPALSGCDALFHVAAAYHMWSPDPSVLYRTNIGGTVDLMRAALAQATPRIVYTSTVAVLAMPEDKTPATEESGVTYADMIGHYKKSKYLAEQRVREMIADDGLPCVIVNPSVPAGPGDVKPTPTGRMILEAARGRLPAYPGGGLNLVHVDDVAAGHLSAFDKGKIGARYILGGENMPIKEALSRAAAIAGQAPPRIRAPLALSLPVAFAAQGWARLRRAREPLVTVEGVRLGEKNMYYSHAKARRELDYRPRPADVGLRDSIRWFRDNGYL